MKREPAGDRAGGKRDVRGTSPRGRWLVLALFVLGGLMLAGLFVARSMIQPVKAPNAIEGATPR